MPGVLSRLAPADELPSGVRPWPSLIGLTKYLATYYAQKGVRANALCPGGVFNGQNDEFLAKLTNLIPMRRIADVDEYKSTVLYLLSDASSYMTGSTVIVDGWRTCW